jgi:hypothetical protein
MSRAHGTRNSGTAKIKEYLQRQQVANSEIGIVAKHELLAAGGLGQRLVNVQARLDFGPTQLRVVGGGFEHGEALLALAHGFAQLVGHPANDEAGTAQVGRYLGWHLGGFGIHGGGCSSGNEQAGRQYQGRK